MEERLTEHKLKTVIDGKLSRYFGVSAKEATKDQIYKAVVPKIPSRRDFSVCIRLKKRFRSGFPLIS